MRHITIGILAHVDAGKTTLSECMLYLSGQIRKLGRVDHKDAFLDTYELERRYLISFQQAPERACMSLHPVSSVDHQDRIIQYLQGTLHFCGEIHMPRCIQKRYPQIAHF